MPVDQSEKMAATLESKIGVVQRGVEGHILSLETFGEAMANAGDAFDDEDMAQVRDRVRAYREQCVRLENLRDQVLTASRHLSGAIEARACVIREHERELDAADSGLLTYFAKRQHLIGNLLSDTLSKIASQVEKETALFSEREISN